MTSRSSRIEEGSVVGELFVECWRHWRERCFEDLIGEAVFKQFVLDPWHPKRFRVVVVALTRHAEDVRSFVGLGDLEGVLHC